MAAYSGSGPGKSGDENSNGIDTLFNQLRQQTRPLNSDPGFHCYYNDHKGYYGQLQSQQPSHLPPAAPTPPVGPSTNRNNVLNNSTDTSQLRINGGITNTDRTSSLLNLLKFSQPSSTSTNFNTPTLAAQPQSISHEASDGYAGTDGPNIKGNSQISENSNLLSVLMNSTQSKPTQQSSSKHPTTSTSKPNFGTVPISPPADTQAYLLQLLNQPKTGSKSEINKIPPVKQEDHFPVPRSKSSSHGDAVEELAQAMGEASLDMSMMGPLKTEPVSAPSKENNLALAHTKNSPGIFTYVNPFEGLAASSPRNRNQRSDRVLAPQNNTVQILKNPRNEITDYKPSVGSENSSPNQPTADLASKKSASNTPPTYEAHKPNEAVASNEPSSGKNIFEAYREDVEQKTKNSKSPMSCAKINDRKSHVETEHREFLVTKSEKIPEIPVSDNVWHENNKFERSIDTVQKDPITQIDDTEDKSHKTLATSHNIESWERSYTENNNTKEEEANIVKVYNFPMRPWTSIVVKAIEEQLPDFREESIIDITRSKRDFDQVDRSLVTASNKFIIYGMSKSGGIRIIRQDDGKDTKLFTETYDRVFDVIISSSAEQEAIIGTGVSGTVYWVQIRDGEGNYLEKNQPEKFGFALPPLHEQQPEFLGGISNTRARSSSNHLDFFAVTNGNFINMIYPSIILEKFILKDRKDRLVDIDAYLSHYSFKIDTGKPIKDFSFSEDDTTIISLDIAGHIKFWDIRSLTKDSIRQLSFDNQSKEVKNPIATFTSLQATENSRPSSILFVDKIRPYQRGGALRYFIIGMKQNHTLQLWDIHLGKPVQEIHLPHSKDSDVACSIVYHAVTGMIVVGHPTRNSIYFLHFSAPKYALPKSISQADYLAKIASDDSVITKPDSTAVICGMREYSFANKGSLRSLDILQTPSPYHSSDSGSLFELYCMHSKGVTCLDIRQADLGWNSENRVVNPVIAENLNMISIDTLKEISIPSQPEVIEHTPQPLNPTRIVTRPDVVNEFENQIDNSTKKDIEFEQAKPALVNSEEKTDKKQNSSSNGNILTTGVPEKMEKKKRRKGPTDSNGPSQNNTYLKMPVIEPSSNSRNVNSILMSTNTTNEATNQSSISGSDLKSVEKLFTSSLDKFFQDFKSERQLLNETATNNHDSILRMISSTLNENIEANLRNIIIPTIDAKVIPIISETASRAVQEQLGANISAQLANRLPYELQRNLPDAISTALHKPQLLKLMSESLASTVAFSVQKEFNGFVANNIIPSVSNMLAQATHKIASDIQTRCTEQVNIIEQQRQSDSMKISKLTQLVTGLSETVSSMAAAQTEFQGQLLKMQQIAAHEKRNNSHSSQSHVNQPDSTPSVELTGPEKAMAEEYDNMMKGITAAMNAGEYENAVIQWLQTRREQEFFVNYFSKFNPEFVRGLSPLLLLSLGATISVDFEGEINNEYISQRISWLETILSTFQAHITAGSMDNEVRDLSPKIMGIYCQRLEHLFMRISQISAHEPILKRISLLVNAANHIVETARGDERLHDYAGELV